MCQIDDMTINYHTESVSQSNTNRCNVLLFFVDRDGRDIFCVVYTNL
jgi:hypothetical protein